MIRYAKDEDAVSVSFLRKIPETGQPPSGWMSIIHFFSLGVIMCNINSALGIEFNLLSFMGKLFNGKLNRPVYKR